jgi:hypothetical protein
MKKKKLLPISITLLLLAIVIVVLVFQLSNSMCSNQILATIDYSNTYATVSTLFQRKTFFYNGTYWLFYCNGANLYYTSSNDGLNWRTPTTIQSGLSSSAMSVWFENGTVQFTSTGGLNVPVIYRAGQIEGEKISWESEQAIILAKPAYEYYNAYSTVDSEGRPWVSFIQSETEFPDSWFTVQITKADSPKGLQWSPPIQVSNNSLIPFRPCLVSLPYAQMYTILVSQNGVEGRLWTGTSWQATETISNRHPTNDFSYSAVSLNGEVHLVYVENATNNVYFYKRLETGEWQENLVSVAQDSVAAVLSVDSLKNTVYCLWIDGSTLHMRKMENSVWSDVAIENLHLVSPAAISSFYEINDGKLGVTLLEKLSQNPLNYRLRYFVIQNL